MLSVYWGCYSSTKQYCIEVSTRNVLKALGLGFVDLEGWSCCGNPLKGINPKLWLYLASRNLALAGGNEILAVCNGCYLSLKEAQHLAETRKEAAEWVGRALEAEGLGLGKPRVVHPIEFFHEVLSSKDVAKPLKGLRLGAHYGCHSLRGPSPGFDSPTSPSMFEDVLELLGAEVARDYDGRLDCCGATLMAADPEVGFAIASSKLSRAKEAGLQCIVTPCPYCFEMLDSRQETLAQLKGVPNVPVLLLQQAIGLAMGLGRKELGLNFNMSPVEDLLEGLG
ncbi:MAG: CoB--CoM heterodisulfide reductase iron-sulfur subunit B family protein [Candidatus Brockarchaeota archaeon]|nr:CoB--CoM heterodisulfide reductase iron-sulfur subunit B family protein [Candidatus Brockarchaeota archaeon]